MKNTKKRTKLIRPLLTIVATAAISTVLIGCGGNATDIPGLTKAFNKVTSYTVEMKGKNAPEGMKQTIKLKDGKLLKMKMQSARGCSIMDFENNLNYMVMGTKAMKLPMSAEQVKDSGAMTPSEFMNEKSKVLKTEKMGDTDCLVIESTMDGETGNIWVGTTDGLVRKSVVGKDQMEFIYTNINNVNNSEFELPKDVKVQDMTQMMGNMQKMMGGN